uniref:Uncharacterized protein n=1 Tax=Arundo donax TaxID=35708 RepID=A0A0A9DD05_ARUDO
MDSLTACAGGAVLVGSLAGAAGGGLGEAAAFFSAAAMSCEGSSLSTSTRRSNWFFVPIASLSPPQLRHKSPELPIQPYKHQPRTTPPATRPSWAGESNRIERRGSLGFRGGGGDQEVKW